MSSGADAPQFDVSAGADTAPVSASAPPTWLSATRIVTESGEMALAAPGRGSTTTTTAVALAVAQPSASSTTVRANVTTTTSVVTATSVARSTASTTAASTSTTEAPRPTTTVAPTTTTTRLLSLPALAPVAPAAKYIHTERGLASWYNAPDRTCAHRTAPKGTVIKVTRTSTGDSTTCTVADWGPEDRSRVIDLSMDTFELLHYASAGLIDVLIEW